MGRPRNTKAGKLPEGKHTSGRFRPCFRQTLAPSLASKRCRRHRADITELGRVGSEHRTMALLADTGAGSIPLVPCVWGSCSVKTRSFVPEVGGRFPAGLDERIRASGRRRLRFWGVVCEKGDEGERKCANGRTESAPR